MNLDEIALLLKKAHKSLQAAQLLLKNNLTDFAVTRTYYTMFYVAQAFLLSKDLSFSSHKSVISAFGREFIKTKIIPLEYHRVLIDTQIKRNEADYDINPTISHEEAQEMIHNAEKMLNFALQYFHTPNLGK